MVMNVESQKEIVFIDFNKLKNNTSPTKEDIDNALVKQKYTVAERKKGKERFLQIMANNGY